MRRLESLLVVAALSALTVGAGACGSGESDGSGGSASTVTQTQTTTVQEPAEDSSSDDSSSEQSAVGGGGGGGSAESWTMPDLTGKDLQTAQDSIQSLTNDAIFFSDSHDVSGQDRMQVLDRGWQVCDQDPGPGTEITADTDIDFGVVRESEQCP